MRPRRSRRRSRSAEFPTDLSNVKTDVGGVKDGNLTKTQGDLATTNSELQSVKGDLSGTNSVIARNHDELVTLEHKGDRNFYEFTIDKGQKKPVGTVSLQLKRADGKRSKLHPRRLRRRQVVREEGPQFE